MIQRYNCVIDNKSEIIEVDTKAQNSKDSSELFSWLFTIFIDSSQAKNLSTTQDILQCKKILIDEFNKSGIYAGSKIVDSWHEIYFYLKSVKGVENKTRDILNNFDYTFQSNAVKDKSWKFYTTELLPNEYQHHHIQNRTIIDELINAGDDITKKREIEHYVVFDTSSLRKKFYDILEQNSLTCKDIFDDDGYYISLKQIENPDFYNMCKFTDKLVKLSDQFYARYIGWNTKLVKDV